MVKSLNAAKAEKIEKKIQIKFVSTYTRVDVDDAEDFIDRIRTAYLPDEVGDPHDTTEDGIYNLLLRASKAAGFDSIADMLYYNEWIESDFGVPEIEMGIVNEG